MVRKYVGNLMFCSKESNGNLILQNKTVYEIQSKQCSTTFRHEHDGKVSMHTSFVSKKLQINYNRRFNKAAIKQLCKISLQGFWKLKQSQISVHIFS